MFLLDLLPEIVVNVATKPLLSAGVITGIPEPLHWDPKESDNPGGFKVEGSRPNAELGEDKGDAGEVFVGALGKEDAKDCIPEMLHVTFGVAHPSIFRDIFQGLQTNLDEVSNAVPFSAVFGGIVGNIQHDPITNRESMGVQKPGKGGLDFINGGGFSGGGELLQLGDFAVEFDEDTGGEHALLAEIGLL